MTAPATDRQPASFLALAPSTSASHPQEQGKPKVPSAMANPSPLSDGSLAQVTKTDGASIKSRTSSVDSEEAKNASRGFLKLGPIHWGEHQDDRKGDWHEAAVQ